MASWEHKDLTFVSIETFLVMPPSTFQSKVEPRFGILILHQSVSSCFKLPPRSSQGENAADFIPIKTQCSNLQAKYFIEQNRDKVMLCFYSRTTTIKVSILERMSALSLHSKVKCGQKNIKLQQMLKRVKVVFVSRKNELIV